jgi:GT2 family glycosyltransferase
VTISVVVPTFRRPESLRDTLNSLFDLDYPRELLEVIVVDDEGERRADEVVGTLDSQRVEVRVESQRRRGAATARNRGAQVAAGELLVFVDDDILVAGDHIQRHLEVRERFGDPLVNGAWEFTPAVRELLSSSQFGRFRLQLEREFQVDSLGRQLHGSCLEMHTLGTWDLSVQRTAFWNLGGFDERFPVAGAEDQDLSLRAREAGHLLVLDTSIVCLHNDNRVDLAAYCAREERSAQTMPLLSQKYPETFGTTPYVVENRPVCRTDSPRLVVKKSIKQLLSFAPCLSALHAVARIAEALRLPEERLQYIYRLLLGLHLFRGFRRAWPTRNQS